MIIDRKQLNVGAYYVLRVDMRKGDSMVLNYHSDYTSALESAEYNFSPDQGFINVVVEVQGVIKAQGVPEIVTSLTRKL